ncbi:MAG: ketopantoate reductase family protein [Burkholderiales bacterium]|jgi:2-dehydropantoate 2-reductase|nr:ketopantoate reductase family protein [Burkholderiales bacterium]
MKILVLGAGGVGGYFGGRLLAAGVNVSFLVRPKRAEQLTRDGLTIISPCGDARLPARTILGNEVKPEYDLVILACKAYDLDNAMNAIAPALRENTWILPLLNGVCHMDALDHRFGLPRILGGSCQIITTLLPDGKIHHLQELHNMIIGARCEEQRSVIKAFAQTASNVNFVLRVSENVLHDLWLKFSFLTTLAGMTSLMRASIGDIMHSDDGAALMREIFDECVAVMQSEGYAAPSGWYDKTLNGLLNPDSPTTASMLRDIERHGVTEGDHIVGDMLRRAQKANIAAPILRVVYSHLQAYEARRRRERAS